MDHPECPDHLSHSDHHPAVTSEPGTGAFLSQFAVIKNIKKAREKPFLALEQVDTITSFVYCYIVFETHLLHILL